MELEVTETDPGFRGDTATNVTKPATLETGTEIKVPCSSTRRQDQDRHPHRRVPGALQGLITEEARSPLMSSAGVDGPRTAGRA